MGKRDDRLLVLLDVDQVFTGEDLSWVQAVPEGERAEAAAV